MVVCLNRRVFQNVNKLIVSISFYQNREILCIERSDCPSEGRKNPQGFPFRKKIGQTNPPKIANRNSNPYFHIYQQRKIGKPAIQNRKRNTLLPLKKPYKKANPKILYIEGQRNITALLFVQETNTRLLLFDYIYNLLKIKEINRKNFLWKFAW